MPCYISRAKIIDTEYWLSYSIRTSFEQTKRLNVYGYLFGCSPVAVKAKV